MEPSKPSISQIWKSASPLLRRILVWSWVLSLTLLLAGIAGDSIGIWEDRAFLTNIISSLAAALFGIPLALEFITRLTNDQAERVRQMAVIELTRQLTERISATAQELMPFGPDVLSKIRDMAADIRLRNHEVYQANRRIERSEEDRAVLDRAATEYRALYALWNGQVGYKDLVSRVLQDLTVQSDFIVDKLHQHFIECGFQWVNPATQASCSYCAADLASRAAMLPRQYDLDQISLDASEGNRDNFAFYGMYIGYLLDYAVSLQAYNAALGEMVRELRERATLETS